MSDQQEHASSKGNIQDLLQGDELTAITHLYRGEMDRVNTWRRRLDVTTNWAIVTTAAFLTFGFGNSNMSHFVFILATIFVLFFLIIEARRYKYYDLWRWRVSLLNENFFAKVLEPKYTPLMEGWRDLLARELQHSRFKISFLEAFGRRLRRNYSWIFFVLIICWITKIAIHPTIAEGLPEMYERANLFHLAPAWLVITVGVVFNVSLLAIGLLTMKKRKEEVRIYPARKSKFKISNI